jgi:hypothetical protein
LPSSPTGMQLTCIFWRSQWKALVTLKQMVVLSCRRSGSAARGRPRDLRGEGSQEASVVAS